MSLTRSPIVAVFPGQGSQHVGMAKGLYENFAIARETFEEASDAIRLDLKKLCFDGPESDLTLTENTQPCLLTASVAAFRVAKREFDFKPGAVAGHSLGEYSALVCSESIDLGMAAQWVRERGLAMQKAVPAGQGTMAAILNMEDERLTRLCEKATALAVEKRASSDTADFTVPALVQPANFNAPGQIVIAGSTDAVQQAIALIKSDPEFSGAKAIPLQVSAPFHCQLMEPARKRMAELFQASAQKPKTPFCPYIPNRTGRLTQEAGLVFDLLIEQIDHPVLWKQSIQALLASEFHTAIEFGPGKVLAGLIKRIASAEGKTCTLASMGDPASLSTLPNLLKAAVSA